MLYSVRDRETMATLTSSIGFTAAKIPPAVTNVMYAVIQAVDADVRFTIDGTAPVAGSTGILLPQEGMIEVWGSTSLAAFRCINNVAASGAKLEVVYMG